MTETSHAESRRLNMAAIRGKDTGPEMMLRRALHAAGYRFRLHDRSLPGSPDLVLRKHRTVVFVHGCFWHLHDCSFFKWPKTRAEFWREKLERNAERDAQSVRQLLDNGWRVAIIWECAVRSKTWSVGDVTAAFTDWLNKDENLLVIESRVC